MFKNKAVEKLGWSSKVVPDRITKSWLTGSLGTIVSPSGDQFAELKRSESTSPVHENVPAKECDAATIRTMRATDEFLTCRIMVQSPFTKSHV